MIQPCYIIITIEDEDAFLATRKRFPTKEAAEEHMKGWAECWLKIAIIVKCPHGLEY